MKQYFIYILASKKNGTLYNGVTNYLIRRVLEHKEKIIKGFTSRYNVDKLVFFETYDYIEQAIYREKCLKKWYRKWKIDLIEQGNKEWKDLFYDMVTENDIEQLKESIYKNDNYGFPHTRE